MKNNCLKCGSQVEPNWKFCRNCGQSMVEEQPSTVEHESDAKEDELSIFDAPLTTRTLEEEIESIDIAEGVVSGEHKFGVPIHVFQMLSSKEDKNKLDEMRKLVLAEIDRLSNRIEAKLISKEDAIPQFKKLSARVDEIDSISLSIPKEEPLKIAALLIEREEWKVRLKELRRMKTKREISKSAYKTAESKYIGEADRVNLLVQDWYIKLKSWIQALEDNIVKLRDKLELEFINYRTGQMTDDEYERRKTQIGNDIDACQRVRKSLEDYKSQI